MEIPKGEYDTNTIVPLKIRLYIINVIIELAAGLIKQVRRKAR